MLRSLLILGAAAIVAAQDSSSIDSSTITATDSSAPSSTSPSSTSSGPITHTIAVARGDHTFDPDVTLAEVGDVIEFEFYPANHSVVRAEYGYPCIPYEDTGINKFGFFSGFKPVDAIIPDPPSWTVTVNDSNPIFFYCGAAGSCINYQMVGVINPNASTSLVTQKQLAKDSSFMLLPGEPWPAEDENPFTTVAPSTSSTPTPTQSHAAAETTSSASSPSSSTHHNGLSTGAIAGIAIGAAAVALGAAVALFLCGRHSRNQRASMLHSQSNVPFIPPSVAGSHAGHMSYASMPSMNKHMSMHSSVFSPALPGYVPAHDGNSAMASPPLHPLYAPSDALNPGTNTGPTSVTDGISPAHSPGVVPAVPAYSPGGQHPGHMSIQSNPAIFGSSSVPQPGAHVHEMAAPLPATGVHHVQSPSSPAPTEGQGAGIMGFIRNSSVSKAGGVERYS